MISGFNTILFCISYTVEVIKEPGNKMNITVSSEKH